MNLTSKERVVLFVTALLVIIVLGTRFLIMPSLDKLEVKKNELIAAQAEEARVNELIAKMDTIDEEIEAMTIKVDEISKPFFTVSSIEYIHRWIVDTAKSFNLKISQYSFTEPVIGPVEPYSVEIENTAYAIGDYYNNIVNATQGTSTQEEATSTEATTEEVITPSDNKDAVVKYTFNLAVAGTKTNILKYVDYMNSMPKHGILNNFSISTYMEDGEKETALGIELYAISKEDDKVFDYRFD